MNNKKFATGINCMDGRVQIPVIDWIKKEYEVDYVDMITEPGPNKILADDKDSFVIEAIKTKVAISIDKHKSKLIVVAGHHDCAGNPVDKDTQLKQILSAIKTVDSWNFRVPIIGLWINDMWEVCVVK